MTKQSLWTSVSLMSKFAMCWILNRIGEASNVSEQQNSTRYSVFWDFTQLRFGGSYRRFGTTYRSHIRGWDWKVVLKRRCQSTNLRCVKFQKNEYLIYIPTESGTHANNMPRLQSTLESLVPVSQVFNARFYRHSAFLSSLWCFTLNSDDFVVQR
jgi:hypothetical protein